MIEPRKQPLACALPVRFSRNTKLSSPFGAFQGLAVTFQRREQVSQHELKTRFGGLHSRLSFAETPVSEAFT